MNEIIIGKSAGKPFTVDVKLLRRTRLLVQANSGGGKSWLLRRMVEQLFGKVPVWIIDPEGEFKSLREKFDFVLVGKGGETPADPRSAELVANKLRELRASVVFDLYDLKPQTRHHYVRVLLEAMMNAPKQLWTPVILKVDEAHMFAPEKGQGESEAFAAMQDVATRGRKRGICMAAYLQRLARLSKTVSAELLNRLVGMTFEDVDVDRAEAVLSVSKADREVFRTEIKHLHAGQFYGLGPAIAKNRTLIQVGNVLTTHPDPDDETQQSVEPPPPTQKIKALLPKLADLPKAAEEKAKTEAELRAEIRSLKAQLAARPKETVERAKIETRIQRIEVPVVQTKDVVRLERAMTDAVRAAGKCQDAIPHLRGFSDLIEASLRKIEQRARKPEPVLTPIPAIGSKAAPMMQPHEVMPKLRLQQAMGKPPRLSNIDNSITSHSADDLTPAKRKILTALAEFEAIGRSDVDRTWVAARAGVSHKSSGYANNLGALRSDGYIEYGAGTVRLTDKGRGVVPEVQRPLNTAEMLTSCLKILSPAQARILEAVHKAHPEFVPRDQLAAIVQVSSASSGYANNLGALRSAGMIEYGPNSTVKASDWLFID